MIKIHVISLSMKRQRQFSTQDKDALTKGIELEFYIWENCEFVLAGNVMVHIIMI